MATIQKTTTQTDPALEKKLKNLKYYQNKAIDFSKRNRLLKYPGRAISIEFDVSFNECRQFFGSIGELRIDLPHKEILKQDNDQEELFEQKDRNEPEVVLPATNITGKKLITQLDKLRLQAKNNFDSHGLHTLFMAVGEIKWKEELAGRGSSEAISEWDYSAPLLLIPIEITKHKAPQKQTVIQLNEELYDIQVNPVLNLFIKQQLELKIPASLPESFTEFSWEEVLPILKKYQKIFKEDKGLDCIITNKIRIGQYTFHGQQIYEDLTRNEKAIVGHEFVSSLCGDSQINQSSEIIQADDEEENVDHFLTEEEDFTILDADESQLRAIKSVVDGKHMVIHGPPGTGKSQTIANLIANLLARGKKVLFVCEKQVALDVVYNRLKTKGADISDLCLPLFQYTTDKKFFAKSIIESRGRIVQTLRSNRKNSINQKLAERKERIDMLENYAQALLTIIEPLGKEVYWIHGELARVAPRVEGVVLPWREKNHSDIDYVLYQKIIALLSELTAYNNIIFDPHNHWATLKQQTFSPDYSARLFSKLEELKKVVVAFPKLEGTVFGKPQNIIEIEKTLNLANTVNIEGVLENRLIVTNKINLNSLKRELEKLETIKTIIEKYQEVSGVSDKFKIPSNWEETKLEYELLDRNFENKTLIANKNNLSILKTKSESLRNTIRKNKHAKELLSFNSGTLKRYKNLFYVDPIVQKIKGWDERINLYEVQNSLKQIKAVYDRLVEAQETLNEWAVSLNNLNKDSLWELEQRFATKYKLFLRVFYPNYKKDISSVTNWCAAHRPQNFRECRQIVFAAADKIRLQNKFEKIMDEFTKKYATDASLKNISVDSLIDSVSKILNYLEETNIDKLNNEIKNLFVATEYFDSFKHIISLLEELLEQRQLINSIVGQDLLTENTSTEDLIKFVGKITNEVEDVILVYEKASNFIIQKYLPVTIAELSNDVESLNNLKSLSDRLIKENFNEHTVFSNIEDLINGKDTIQLQQEQINSVLPIITEHNFSKADFYKNLEVLYSNIGVWKTWHKTYQQSKEELQNLMNNDKALADLELVKISDFSEHINEMITDVDGLEKWMKYQRIRGQLEEYGMLWFVEDIKKYQIDKTDFSDIFVSSFMNKVLDEVHSKNEILKNFNIADYTRCISEFKRLEKEVFEVNQHRVLDKIYPQIRSAMNYGGQSERYLVQQSRLRRPRASIRRIVSEHGAHIFNFKPCWLMSPLTLSSYIPFGSVEFDVVIFDEASQMKIENALGAIARAKQVVIIGDEHQLPPTSFFQDDGGLFDGDEDSDDIDYESILDAAIPILPEAQNNSLTYHYRSRHPNLIVFSNHHIYDDLLTIFPVPKDYEAVKFEFVENGIYDAGHTRSNRIEAIRVAELCISHFESSSTSLGVIAFSKAQEEAIRDAITEKISLGEKHSYLADKFDETTNTRNKLNEESSFFIRNLESAQGDQRDTIILSVGYGPDINGNVFNRFGPINSKGGHRRLNVAVTRARDKIICVSSMKFHQMSPSEGTRGAILLQRYLEYAEKGRGVLDASKTIQQNNREPDSDFEVSVQKELQRIGYTIHPQVGAAGFYIDLAVVNPDHQNEYVLGIECDGAAYHSSKSARIRDRLRQEILERLGWKIYRVWSQHWIVHRQEVLDDIVKYINQI